MLGRSRAGEHRREADDRPRRIGRLDAQVLGPLAGEPVHDRRLRLPEPLPVAAVDDDDVHAPRERLAGAGRERLAGGPLGVARQPLRESAGRHRSEPGGDRERERDAGDAAGAGLLREECRGAQRYEELGQLLERVAARRVGVGQDEPPEAQAVGPRRAGAEVVVDRPPHDDREEEVTGERAEEQARRAPRLEQRHRGGRGQPQQRTPPQREREAHEHDRGCRRPEQSEAERPIRRKPRHGGRRQHEQRVHERERPALVEHVPGTRRPDLEGPRRALPAGAWSAAHAAHGIRAP